MPYPCPQEGLDFELAEHFRWSWADLDDCPMQVRELWTRLLMAKRRKEADEMAKAKAADRASPSDRREARSALAEAEAATANDPEVLAWRASLEQQEAASA